jgi:hypothetical protein
MESDYDIPDMVEDKLIALGRKLGALFDKQVKRRKQYVDERMPEDYRAYQGKYTQAEEARFDKETHRGSRAFANLIRPKTNSLIAKLSDILFPADESNFVLKRDRYSEPGSDESIAFMQQTIVEQLQDAHDAGVCRDVIRDGAIFGTGIYKGPVLSNRVRKIWQTGADGTNQLTVSSQAQPDCQCVRPWNFFPDMNAARLGEAEFVFERQYLSRGELQDVAKLPGILPTITRVLKTSPDDINDRDVADDMREQVSELEPKEGWLKYPLVMYHGPVLKSDLICSGEYGYEELAECPDEFSGELWFIRELVIKMIIYPMDRVVFPYSVWSPEEDDQSIFGYGVPHLLNHPQKIRNSAK